MIVNESYLPTNYKRKSKDNGIFYYALLQDRTTRRRYLKIGTSERGVKRFIDRDYKKYSFIKILYIAECDNKTEIYDMEDLNKTILRNQKGLKWHKSDRFTYFILPKLLPVSNVFGELRTIHIRD